MTGLSTVADQGIANERRRPRTAELVLGTAQLGLAYGILNAKGMLECQEAIEIVRGAVAGGVRWIDTARAYGDSERRIGLALSPEQRSDLTVVTKLATLDVLPHGAPPGRVREAVDESILASMRALNADRLQIVLLHRASHLTAHGGLVWRRLLQLRQEGRIERLGVSVQSPSEALEALQDPGVSLIQLPFNLLDWRWEAAGVPARLEARPDVIVHVRSALLQGVLTTPDPAFWPAVGEDEAREMACAVDRLRTAFGRRDLVDLCMAYVRAMPWVDGVVVGVLDREQLRQNVELFRSPPLSAGQVEEARAHMPRASEALLDPARWPSTSRH